ncbi:hypothetical protein VTO42DRAFT_4287 [Malbranchea cinnamomea]
MGLIPTRLPFISYLTFHANQTAPSSFTSFHYPSLSTVLPFSRNITTASKYNGNASLTASSFIVSSAVRNYLDMSSVVLALDILATVQAPRQIYYLCAHFPSRTLEEIGFSDAIVSSILCNGPMEPYVPIDPDDMREVRSLWVTGMWLQQTYVALGELNGM